MAFPDSTVDDYYTHDIDNTNIDSDLTDFPVRFDLANGTTDFREWLESNLDAAGDGLRVTDTSDVVLDYTLENFAKAGGVVTGQLTFKCSPTAASALTVRIFASSTEANSEDESGTYSSLDNGYNFEQDPNSGGTLLDVTSANLDVPSVGSMTSDDLIDGNFGKCWDFDGSNDGAYSASVHWPSTSVTEWSGYAWVYHDTIADQDIFFCNDQGGFDQSIQVGISPEGSSISPTGKFAIIHQGDSHRTVCSWSTSLSSGTWYQVGWASDADDLIFYVNGVEVDRTAKVDVSSGLNITAGDLSIGIRQTIREWNGRISMLDLFESNVGPAWVKFNYANINESDNELQNSTFVAAGGGGSVLPIIQQLMAY